MEQFLEVEIMCLEGETIFYDELSSKIQMCGLFLVFEDQQIGIHVFFDDFFVLSLKQMRSRIDDHVMLV